jgi:PAS domain S-box-containing protein
VRTRALAESERKYRLLVENQNDLVVQFDADNLLQFTSPNCCTTFGKTEEELLGEDFTHLVHEEDRATVASSLEGLRRPPHVSEHQERVLTVHGWRWFAWVAKGMLNEAGELESVVSVGRDVTEHRKAEEEIRRLNRELEQRVATRTSELQGAVRELEGLDYMVSHDLRAPVLHVGAFAELLLESHSGVLDDKGRYHLEAIRDSAGKMYELVENLLVFSRLGRATIQRSRVDMSRLVHEVWSALAADRDTSRASLEVRPLPPATGDSDLLKMVWRNLLDNALKFSMLCDEPSVTIDSYTADGRTWYRVADNGVGFDQRYADKLFGVFQRLHHEDEYPGTGVGLAIVERIVRRHGGRVRGLSAVGEGATFEFMLGQE